MPKKLFFITGPTAVGKTQLSLKWAEDHDAEIISCDSLLVYQGMDVGTAKPTKEELRRVKHHLIDCVNMHQPFSVAQYIKRAQAALNSIYAQGKRALVVGGSGFYLKSFFAPIIDPVVVTHDLKERVLTQYQTQGLCASVDALMALNPKGLQGLDIRNPRRVIRALELCLATGLPLEALNERLAKQRPPFHDYEKEVCLLTRSPETLKTRVRARVLQMIHEGLIDEVKKLKDAGLQSNPSASQAIGYRETLAWLKAGETSPETLIERICVNTNALIRKQRTWFKKQIPINYVIDLDADLKEPLFKGL